MEKRHKILLIDDSPLTVKILKNMLKADYDVITVYSAIKGLEIAEKENPDLIILDVIMSPMDGYEACRRLKENILTKSIPVIFITALGEMEDEKRGLEIGAIDYITKPFSEPIIKIRVKNHLELKHNRDILAELSSLDGLTGIYNRRYFDSSVELEWDKAIKNNTPFSVILLDIDKFKIYNDSYGHLEGDECLRQVAKCIDSGMVKRDDISARFGGEEFICLLPNTDLTNALAIANKIMSKLENLHIPFPHSPVKNIVTLSAGLGTIYANDSLILTDFLKAVDDMMYLAKNNGRNQIKYKNMD